MKFAPRIYNLTNTKFNKKETTLLSQGLSFNLHESPSIVDILLNAEKSLHYVKTEDIREIRNSIYHQAQTIQLNNKKCNKNKEKLQKEQKKTILSLNKKLKNGDLSIVKVDKSKSLAIMENKDLNEKVSKFIDENKIHELKKDPTKNYTSIVNLAITKCTAIIPENIQYKLKYTIPNTNAPNLNTAKAPKFIPIIKLHKPGNPIRPLVNGIGAPTYKLAKFIDNIIKRTTKINNEYAAINTVNFAKKVEGTILQPQDCMISLDIVNLYMNIPKKEAIQCLKDKLVNEGNLNDQEINQIILLTETILQQNYFMYNNKYYICSTGIAMGGPLSSTISQIYLNKIEENKIMNVANPYQKHITTYFRHVDDTFMIFSGTKRVREKFLKYVNTISDDIKFTSETMENNEINFLDLTIYKDKNNSVKFKIFRKKTTTDIIIPYKSNHPARHKHAAIHSMAHRVHNVPLTEDNRTDEIACIHQICKNNGYPTYIVNNILNKHKIKVQNNDGSSIDSVKNKSKKDSFIPVKFYNNNSYHIEKIFKDKGYHAAFHTRNNLRNKILRNNYDNNKRNFETPGVYRIECKKCMSEYIGKTERTVATRFKEHTTDIRSNVYQHIQDNNCTLDLKQNVEILYKSSDRLDLSVREKYEITKAHKAGKTLMNVQTEIDYAQNMLIEKCCTLTE